MRRRLPALKITAASANAAEGAGKNKRPIQPLDGDTRLQSALRQISSRFSRVPPQGIVVFSDGRVHDETGLEQIAAGFAKLKVPIHVVPVGDTAKGGDVAIAAVVAPPRVRKFTEVEVQVFVRSFGYDGKRSEVQLLRNRPEPRDAEAGQHADHAAVGVSVGQPAFPHRPDDAEAAGSDSGIGR